MNASVWASSEKGGTTKNGTEKNVDRWMCFTEKHTSFFSPSEFVFVFLVYFYQKILGSFFRNKKKS